LIIFMTAHTSPREDGSRSQMKPYATGSSRGATRQIVPGHCTFRAWRVHRSDGTGAANSTPALISQARYLVADRRAPQPRRRGTRVRWRSAHRRPRTGSNAGAAAPGVPGLRVPAADIGQCSLLRDLGVDCECSAQGVVPGYLVASTRSAGTAPGSRLPAPGSRRISTDRSACLVVWANRRSWSKVRSTKPSPRLRRRQLRR
jgi:hypothetical protein